MSSFEIKDPVRLIDLGRYPIVDLQNEAGAGLLAAGRAALAKEGACVLPGFLRAEAVEQCRQELEGRIGEAYYCRKDHNPYLIAADEAYAAEHPRNRSQVSDLGALADDQIPEGSLLRRLYRYARLQDFVAALLGVAKLYPYADPLGSLNLNVFQSGQQLGWHFDNAEWSLTLMLQAAEIGGVYEYAPNIRTPGEAHYEAVEAVLDGRSPDVRKLAMGPGALVLFRGRHSIHRVTPVGGDLARLVAVLSYSVEAGAMLTEYNRALFYGRTH